MTDSTMPGSAVAIDREVSDLDACAGGQGGEPHPHAWATSLGNAHWILAMRSHHGSPDHCSSAAAYESVLDSDLRPPWPDHSVGV